MGIKLYNIYVYIHFIGSYGPSNLRVVTSYAIVWCMCVLM